MVGVFNIKAAPVDLVVVPYEPSLLIILTHYLAKLDKNS
jgi:hypothetical protein